MLGLYTLTKHKLTFCAKMKETGAWRQAMATFEEHIRDRDLVMIKSKMEIRKHQGLFQKIYLKVIDLLESEPEKSDCAIQTISLLCRLEVIKTIRDQICLSPKSADLCALEQKHTDLLFGQVAPLKKSLVAQKKKAADFEKVFRQSAITRHCTQLVKRISAKILAAVAEGEVDLKDQSSATSTPINCKSLQSSVQNSNLKKRNYQEFNKAEAKLDLCHSESKESSEEQRNKNDLSSVEENSGVKESATSSEGDLEEKSEKGEEDGKEKKEVVDELEEPTKVPEEDAEMHEESEKES